MNTITTFHRIPPRCSEPLRARTECGPAGAAGINPANLPFAPLPFGSHRRNGAPRWQTAAHSRLPHLLGEVFPRLALALGGLLALLAISDAMIRGACA